MKASSGEADLNAALVSYRPRIAAFVGKLAPVGSDVDDIVQETLLKMAKGWDNFKGESALSSWIFKIASNVLVDHMRALSVRPVISIAEPVNLPSPVEINSPLTSAMNNQMSDCVQGKVAILPEAYREVLIKHDIEGVKLKEIAQNQGVNVNSIKVRLHRARKKFRKLIEEACELSVDERNVLICEGKCS